MAKRDRSFGSKLSVLIVAVCIAGVIAAKAPTAHALDVCTTPCPVVANEDDYTVTYTPTGVTVHATAATGVLANDSGPSTTVVDLQDTPDIPSTHAVTTLNGFTATINNDGSFSYHADETFSGVDQFDYFIWDSKDHDNLDVNTVYITIVPVVVDDSYSTTAGHALTVAEPGVGGNDLGIEPTSIAPDEVSTNGGTVADLENGAFTYTPPAGFSGIDTFSYDVFDLDFDYDYMGVVHITVSATAPDAPTLVAATPVAGASASVAFTPPANNGGSLISSYNATCTSSNGGVTRSASGAAAPIVVPSLTNGATYTCTVKATNSIGTSAPSAPSAPFVATSTVATAPGPPRSVVAARGNASASVAFAAPLSDGGAAITSYSVSCVSSNGGVPNSASGAASPVVVSLLTNGASYTCTVTATNSVGTGPPSVASNVFVPATVPGAPTGATATPGVSSASVAFTAPASDGGATITGYTASCASSNGGLSGSASGPSIPIVVAGLTSGKAYTCTVTATNAVGTGSPSLPSNSFTVPTVPDAPTNIIATPGAASATVAFTAPVNDGGSAITLYTAACASSDGGNPGGASNPASPIVVSGLTPGKTYTCTATATNAVGESPSSAVSNAFLPIAAGPLVSVGDVAVLEGNSSTRAMSFRVTLSKPATSQVTVTYTVTSDTATVAAKAGSGVDVIAKSGSLVFKVGTTGKTATMKAISARVQGDTADNQTETFKVKITGVLGGDVAVGRAEGVGTVINDDSSSGLGVGVGDAALVAGTAGTRSLAIPVTLSDIPSGNVAVTYTVTAGDATYGKNAAVVGAAYGGKQTGTLSFVSGGTRTKTVTIPIWPSTAGPGNTAFTVTLNGVTLNGSPGGVTIVRGTGTGTIIHL